MDRRQALKLLSLLAGGSIALPAYAEKILHYPDAYWQAPPEGFPPEQSDLLAALAETILPPTGTPGAREAGVHHVIPVLLDDCTDDATRAVFRAGLERLDAQSRERFLFPFALLSLEQRTTLVGEWQDDYHATRKQPGAGPHFFKIAKDLTLLGYFTSEIGATQALRYLPIPGKWEADIPLQPGEKAWAL